MRKEYMKPEIEVQRFDIENVITSSAVSLGDNEAPMPDIEHGFGGQGFEF